MGTKGLEGEERLKLQEMSRDCRREEGSERRAILEILF